jgi:hypothetical protein
MDEIFLVKNGVISLWDGIETGGTHIFKPELIESFGYAALEEIYRFGSYRIKK